MPTQFFLQLTTHKHVLALWRADTVWSLRFSSGSVSVCKSKVRALASEYEYQPYPKIW